MENKKKIILIVSIIIILASIATSIFLLTKKDKEEPFTIEGINIAENKEVLKVHIKLNYQMIQIQISI